MKMLATALLLVSTMAGAADLRTATTPPGQRYISSGTAGNFSTITASTITATQKIGVSTTAPVWPLTVVNTGTPNGISRDGAPNSSLPVLGMFWNQYGRAYLHVRASTDTAGIGSAVEAGINIESIGRAPGASLNLNISSGTYSARTLIAAANRGSDIFWGMWTSGGTYSTLARISGYTEGIPASVTNAPAYMGFYTASTGTVSATEKVRLAANGGFQIGSLGTGDAMLVVKSTAGNTTNALFQDASAVTIMSVPPTTSGSFYLDTSSMSLKAGVFSVPVQSGARASVLSGTSFPTAGGPHDLFWDSASGGSGRYNHQNSWGPVASSSSTITTRGAGGYNCTACIDIPAASGVTQVAMYLGTLGTTYGANIGAPPVTRTKWCVTTGDFEAADGSALRARVEVTGGTLVVTNNAHYDNHFSCVKVW
jgi:hypothetical protein